MAINKKKFTLEEIEKILSGTFKMVISDSKYFYSSSVDPKFSGLTPEGEHFSVKILNEFLPLLQEWMEHDLDERAKYQVFNTLKGDDK